MAKEKKLRKQQESGTVTTSSTDATQKTREKGSAAPNEPMEQLNETRKKRF